MSVFLGDLAYFAVQKLLFLAALAQIEGGLDAIEEVLSLTALLRAQPCRIHHKLIKGITE